VRPYIAYVLRNRSKPRFTSNKLLAPARLYRPPWEADQVVVAATAEAEKAHGAKLRKALAEEPEAELRRIPSGRSEEELWQHFEVLRDALR
jgi:hypothetical protein